MAYAVDHDGATAFLHEKRTWLPVSGKPNARGSWWMLALVIEGLSMLGEQSQAGQLYPLAREFVSTGGVVLLPFCRFTQTIAGIAAAAARLFKMGRLFDRVPVDRRRWEPGGDLTETAKEISKYIADSGFPEATIVASDEL